MNKENNNREGKGETKTCVKAQLMVLTTGSSRMKL
jgi:hypothetical protein